MAPHVSALHMMMIRFSDRPFCWHLSAVCIYKSPYRGRCNTHPWFWVIKFALFIHKLLNKTSHCAS